MIRYATLTNQGGRTENEDSIGVFSNGDMQLFVLCDGLGGHGMGADASKLVVDVFGKQFEHCDDPVNFLGEAFTAAQDALMAEQTARHAKLKMKTTCVSLLIDKEKVRLGHVGDSRLYIFKGGRYKWRTLDHSIPQMLVLSRDIKEKEIRNHPQRSYVTRVMGIEWDNPMYELEEPMVLKPKTAYMLCSDGLWELIEEKEMSALLKKSSSPDEWLKNMEEYILKAGKDLDMDNYSAIAVWVEKG